MAQRGCEHEDEKCAIRLYSRSDGCRAVDAVGMFAAYRVSSYDEEITILKQWIAERLAFLDRNIDRFDSDWEPRIQPLVEKKMAFPMGGFPIGN